MEKKNATCVLGISAFYHDSSAALIRDGEIVAAVQEERFSRVKFDHSFPVKSIEYCLSEAGIGIDDLEAIVFYEDTDLKFDRIVRTYSDYFPKSGRVFCRAMREWFSEKLFWKRRAKKLLNYSGKIHSVPHHLSHAASAYYPSGFEDSALLVVDGVGEWASTSIGKAVNGKVELLKEIPYPHSLGIFYSAFTQFCGFKVNSGEYKLMGLAPYGQPVFKDRIIEKMMDLKEDGSYRLNLEYFDFHTGRTTIGPRFSSVFGIPPRQPETPMDSVYEDIAASIQAVFNEIIVRLAKTAHELTGSDKLCYAGGVGLNCVANGHVALGEIFSDVWVQPASGDAGGALGAALHHYHTVCCPEDARIRQQPSYYLGPSYEDAEIGRLLDAHSVEHELFEDEAELLDRVAGYLEAGKVVGWFQGRMEFGPRALGARSILGDPRSCSMQRRMNLQIKYRESFRPFAPAILNEHRKDYFDMDYESPYMLFVGPVAQDKLLDVDDEGVSGMDKLDLVRSKIPAVTHVDNSARVQTVHKETNPRFHALLEKFHEKTGCPLVVNTSFNVRGEPIVCSPADALKCFISTDMDVLVAGGHVVERGKQDLSRVGAVFLEPELVNLNGTK